MREGGKQKFMETLINVISKGNQHYFTQYQKDKEMEF